ncbi:MAG: 2Fe-2S iron-sulfur cluster-binding protein, partial [Pseudomonadota bacterium]
MRLDGNQIDLTKPITFKFNNKFYQGYHGDTLASALLASGVKLVGRSFKYHRPRGILSAGAEEPNALVEVGTGAYLQPNVRATMVEIYEGLVAKSQNCWPNVNYDLGATASLFSRILPAGFYYKTFMWPSQAWLFYERFIRKAAGLGKASELKDPDQYTQRHAHCDLLIAGGGLSGLAAALNAKRSNLRVIIVDEQSSWGGFAKSESLEFDQIPICQWIQKTVDELSQAPHVTLLNRTTLSGYFDQNFLTALERVRDHLPAGQNTQSPRQRFWKIRAKHVILAQGAIERPLVFPQNDTPSIMMAGSVATYLKCYGVANAHSCLVYTNNNSAYQSAIELHHAGVQVTIADQRPDQEKNPHPLVKKAFSEGLVIHSSVYVDACHGKKTLKNVSLKYFDQKEDSQTIEIACDLLAMSGGWVPSVHLFSQAKGKLKFAPDLHAFLPDICHQKLTSVGACNGIFNPLKAILHAQSSVQKIARTLGFKVADIETIKQARLLGQSVQSIYDFLPVWTNPIFTKSARYK